MSALELSTFDTATTLNLQKMTWTDGNFQYRLVAGFAFLLEIEVVG